MNKKHFPESELIINADGSCFHLHLKPEQLADKVILVGDPARVDTVAAHFDSKECEVSSREFHTITGMYKGQRITCQSHGIGCDNIDIVVNELDTLANIDYNTREEKDEHRTLTMVRIGTCGGLQPFTPTGSFIASVKSIGFDGLLNYYAGRNVVCDIDMEKAFCEHMQWDPIKGAPYVSLADEELIDQIAGDDMVRGFTISCGGFYGPQGRVLRADIADPKQNEKIESFEYEGMKICNFEMESSAVAGLASLLGHRAMTCGSTISQRPSRIRGLPISAGLSPRSRRSSLTVSKTVFLHRIRLTFPRVTWRGFPITRPQTPPIPPTVTGSPLLLTHQKLPSCPIRLPMAASPARSHTTTAVPHCSPTLLSPNGPV